MGTDGGPRAWAFLRRNPVYREASREASQRPVFEAAQVPVRAGTGAAIGARLALWHVFDPESGDASARLEDLRRVASEAAQYPRHGGRGIDRELLTVLDGRLAGKSWRETAVDLYGADAVAAEWHADGWMRARVRRRGEKARMLMESGYRDLAAGW